MNVVNQAWIWLNDPLNWTNSDGILALTWQHLWISAVAVAIGCMVAWPVGIWLGHLGRGSSVTVAVANLTRAVPTLALLSIFPLTFLGFGSWSAIIALAIFAVPPLLGNAVLGLREVDPSARDAAYGMGLSSWQVLWQVELPLSVPYLATGFRTAAVQVVATATLAALVGGPGLGAIISQGFGLGLASGGGQVLAGGLLVVALCLIVEGLLVFGERAVTPQSLRPKRRPSRLRAAFAR
ncbi:MAG: ABC transporter permease [Actinocatenispora sp.]